MGSKSDYLENKVLDHIFGNTAYTAPATIYIALFTVAPSDSGGGTEVSASGSAYARAAITNNTTNFPNASSGSKNNGVDISYSTATSSWGTVVAWAAFDASTSGNMLYWGAVSPSKTIGIGDTVKFPSTSGLTITED